MTDSIDFSGMADLYRARKIAEKETAKIAAGDAPSNPLPGTIYDSSRWIDNEPLVGTIYDPTAAVATEVVDDALLDKLQVDISHLDAQVPNVKPPTIKALPSASPLPPPSSTRTTGYTHVNMWDDDPRWKNTVPAEQVQAPPTAVSNQVSTLSVNEVVAPVDEDAPQDATEMRAQAHDWYSRSKAYLEDRLGVLKENWMEDKVDESKPHAKGQAPQWTPKYYEGERFDPRIDPALAHASHFYAQNPKVRGLATIGGGLVANAMLGNPIGGVIDAVTGNVLNLRRDEGTAFEQYVPNNSIKPLSAEDVQRQRDYLNRKIAVDTLTLNELRRMGAINETSNPNASYNPEFYQP